MKKFFFFAILIVGIWWLSPKAKEIHLHSMSHIGKKNSHSDATSVEIAVESQVPSSSTVVLGGGGEISSIEKKYKSEAEVSFYHSLGRRMSEPYRIKLYEDVKLTPDEASALNQNEQAAENEVYQLSLRLDKIPKPSREELMRLFIEPREKIYERLEQKQIDLVGEGRYRILIEGKEKYADDYESRYGTRPSIDGW
ncbi:hypothetical protein [Bdellovibrio sp. HCB-110]|uniref:hypothetical protein n=1 Tax=Bdellovibrio sp. HCB-110 TaxID=3391182 RepID=UPI0039B41C1A